MNNIIRVLLIEDSPEYADMIRELLKIPHKQKWYFNVDHVDRLQTALELLTHTRFDVILSDLDLPDSRGIETVKTLTDLALPLVVLTGSGDKDTKKKCKQTGVQEFLDKRQVTQQLLINTLVYAIMHQWAKIRGQK